MKRPLRRCAFAVLGVALALGVTGCATKTVPRDELVKAVSEQWQVETGRPPQSVTCQGDLPLEKDAAVRCDVSNAGQHAGAWAETEKKSKKSKKKGKTVKKGKYSYEIEFDVPPR